MRAMGICINETGADSHSESCCLDQRPNKNISANRSDTFLDTKIRKLLLLHSSDEKKTTQHLNFVMTKWKWSNYEMMGKNRTKR